MRALVAVALVAATPCALACGGSGDETPGLPVPTPGTPVYPFEDTATSIEFLDAGDVTLVAGTPRELRVRVQPPGPHIVRFALLRAEDAFLSSDLVTTEADGTGSTQLTALSASPGFSVLTMVGRLQQALRVVALEPNLGSLLLQANYLGGTRTVPRWFASVHVNRSCAELSGPPFPDGEALASSTTPEVQIDRVPAGAPLAAILRAERFAYGCRNITLRAGSNTISEVEVRDRPLQLAELALRLSFSVEQEPNLNPGLDELAFRAVGPLLGGASDDLAAVLDAMSALATDSVAFEQARTERNWRAILLEAIGGTVAGSGLRTALDGWMSAGLEQLSQPDALVGLLGAPNPAGEAPFTLSSVSGLGPEAAGFGEQSVAAVSTESGDQVGVAVTLSWQPTPLLAALAERVAVAETGASSVPDALAQELDCVDVAELLVDAGASPGEAFAECDDDCMLRLCDDAMAVLWSRVTDTEQELVPWQLSGVSSAEIDADARPISMSSTWVGSLTLSDPAAAGGTLAVPIEGPFVGSTPE